MIRKVRFVREAALETSRFAAMSFASSRSRIPVVGRSTGRRAGRRADVTEVRKTLAVAEVMCS